ncbi:MAG: methyltransferase domain-containing protein [Xanthobacteraceae bacterium]
MKSLKLIAGDPELRAILDAKGRADGVPVPTNANAIPVRRILSLAETLARGPLPGATVLDLACQEGCYAIEFALAGAQAVGVEGRDYHVQRARLCAEKAGVSGLIRFDVADIRHVDEKSYGRFDIVLLLGILYHLDALDAVDTLVRLANLTNDLLIIDTHIALSNKSSFEFRGRTYEGTYVREHNDGDSPEQRFARRQASIDNTFAFYFTRVALTRLLVEVGFPIVVEALAPLDVTKPADRATFVAFKRPVRMGRLYPWAAGLSEDEIASAARPFLPPPPSGHRAKVAHLANVLLRKFGFMLTPH